tara:strand:- start:42 stop:188 length:147 start_codon:yes stop_codon:yes gene_type:complete
MKNLFTHWSTKDLEEYAEHLIQKNVCTDERLYKTVIRVDKELQRRGIN